MVDNSLLVIAAAVLLGFFWLTVWLIKKIRRGEIGVSASSALLLLVAALLLVPFAMNFSAHLISQVMHHKGGTENASPQPAHPD
jgi:predicted PurR-regulated permease PerM